jgi:MOSC domain-containing protein YiiM
VTDSLASLVNGWARTGAVVWLGVRPARRVAMEAVDAAEIGPAGLAGDHRTEPGKRAVTLLQAEHLPVIAALAALGSVDPALLRRNVVVAGINLLGLRARRFRLGTAVLEGTGPCAPCSRMEEALGRGGYAAVRGHGGICAQVIASGRAARGDALTPLD